MPRSPTTGHAARRNVAASVLGVALISISGCSNGATRDVTSTPRAATGGGSVKLDATSSPPWQAPQDVPARVARAGLDLGPMGMAEHYHPQLRIVINGDEVPVAANIGVDPSSGAMSAVHTHDGDGTIHIEAGKAGEKFTLGQLFMQWGVQLTSTQIGGVGADSDQKVSVISNGTPVTGDPKDLRLRPEQKIVVRVR